MFGLSFWRFLGLITLTATTCTASAQNILWSQRLEHLGRNDTPSDMVIDDASNVYILGTTAWSGGVDALLTKYGANGQRAWVKKIGTEETYEYIRQVQLDPQGNILIGGSVGLESGLRDILIQKLDTNGKHVWRRTYGDPSLGEILGSLNVDSSGNVYAAGYFGGSGLESDIAVLKYSPEGKLLWVRRYGNQWMRDIGAISALDSAGNLYVLGQTAGVDTDWDIVLLKYTPDGRLLWIKRIDGPYGQSDYADALAIDSSGNVVVVATADFSQDECDVMVLKFAPAGRLLWTRVYGAFNGRRDGFGRLAIDPQDNVAIAAYSDNFWGANYLVLHYGPDGSRHWSKFYDSPYGFDEMPRAVTVDAEGNFYVTGESYQKQYENSDYLTVKYGPDGSKLWVRRYDSPSQLTDTALGIAIAPDGNVVVTGYSYLASIDLAPDADFFTIKYRP